MGHRAGEVSGGGGADRRGARRTPATGRVTLSRDGGAQAVHGTIENLSRGGVLVAVHGEPAALTPERVCEVELLLVGRAPVRARAHPVRREPAPGGVLVALAFAEVSAPRALRTRRTRPCVQVETGSTAGPSTPTAPKALPRPK